MNPRDTLEISLKNLIIKIISEIQVNISSIQQETRIFINDRILDFEYTEKGSKIGQYQNEYTTETFYRFPQNITNSIKATIEYNSILQDLDLSTAQLDSNSLDRFFEAVVDTLSNKANLSLNDEEIDAIVIKFLRDVYQEPFKVSAEVELVGVVIESESIKLDLCDFIITLRQTKIEDLQKRQLIYPHIFSLIRPRLNLPSSMMNIESHSVTEPCILQDEIEKIVIIFSLFRVSSASYISYTMDSEAILNRNIGGKISKNKHINVLEILRVTRENYPELLDFQKSICDTLPKGLYMGSYEKDMIHLSIAYRNYSEALLNTVRTEEKVMNAVIGLESLLLAENQEISFRFCIRGAKILSLLSFESLRVRNLLKIAYDIRSSLVHGDDIELDKKVRKLSENPQETNLFLIELLNYLRALIVAMIFLSKNNDFIKISERTGTKNFDKKKFLDIVDNSLISIESEEQLRKLLTFK